MGRYYDTNHFKQVPSEPSVQTKQGRCENFVHSTILTVGCPHTTRRCHLFTYPNKLLLLDFEMEAFAFVSKTDYLSGTLRPQLTLSVSHT
jgi:hypothetical protein